MANLSVEFKGIKFKNPIVASAGEPTTDYSHMKKAIEAGAGAVVAKSICFSPQLANSYVHARWIVLDEYGNPCKKGKIPRTNYFYGRGGIPLEPDGWIEELQKTQKLAEQHNCVLIGSVATGPIDKIVETAVRMEKAGIKIIELDAGCPQAGQLTTDSSKELVRSSDFAREIAENVVKAVKVPVIYKVAAEDPELLRTAAAVVDAGIDAVTLINRYGTFMVDIENGRPHIDSWAAAGGPWMLPLSLKWVSRFHQAYPNTTIFGSNGVAHWSDAVQFLMSGATFVCMCTDLMLNGYGSMTKVIKGLDSFLDRKGYSSVQDIIGLAVRNGKTYEALYSEQKKAVIDHDSCIECGICAEKCFYTCIELDQHKPIILDKCKGCGLCTVMCPEEAIHLE